ncbi:gamma-glutamylcyclotransferase family protein [Deinococcus radiomollis]|uniref:gamma-glutamylcyclotransferase family protein n=1 Tax=Deinococcus radiomollis TaxID=468916 RepID=UPI0038925EBC
MTPAESAPPHRQADERLPRSVFVYGTLMPGECNAGVAQAAGGPDAQERATLSGYTLHDLRPEGYPALTPGEGLVQGWLLHYSAEQWPAALVHLDELEGLHLSPPLYTRTQAQASTASGKQTVWVYLYARLDRLTEAGCAAVPSGDWTTVAERQAETR